MREWFKVEARGGKVGGGEILIYDVIGQPFPGETTTTAKAFVTALKKLANASPGDIHIRINSPGGDVADGMAIYSAIQAIKDRVVCTVEGVAFSVAATVALAGRETRMADVAQFMVTNPTTAAYGDIHELTRALAGLKTSGSVIAKAYAAKTGKSLAQVQALMDKTAFMTADEAKRHGFVDTIVTGAESGSPVAARFDAAAWEKSYTTKTGNGKPGSVIPFPASKKTTGRMAQLRAACPGASAETLLAWHEAGTPIAAAAAVNNVRLAATIKEQNEALAKSTQALDRARAELAEVKAKASKPKPSEVKPLGFRPDRYRSRNYRGRLN